MASRDVLTQPPQAILLAGPDGCGKSELMRVFSALCGMELHELAIFPETEPSAFIGQYQPSLNAPTDSKNEDRIKWEDGVVTTAWRANEWVLLDNLSQADPR
jgi:MoxR-like ATPase